MWLGKYLYGWLPLLLDGHMEDHHLGKIPIYGENPCSWGPAGRQILALSFLLPIILLRPSWNAKQMHYNSKLKKESLGYSVI
jgi:hypothetical protein